MNIVILKDSQHIYQNLLPLTFTRPVSQLRIGIFTVAEKWQRLLDAHVQCLTEPLLQPLYPVPDGIADSVVIDSRFLPTPHLAQTVARLQPGQALVTPEGEEIARKANPTHTITYTQPLQSVRHLYDIFLLNGNQIRSDISLLRENEYASPAAYPETLLAYNTIIGPLSNLYVHPTAKITGATINLIDGPVYIGPQAIIMEGATLRGPIAVCSHSEIKMGARIYEDTTVGPHCKVGGEIANVVFIAHSNKAHDGFLGNAVIGEWCNLGGGTVSSNLKNDYSEIKLWNYPSRRFLPTGLQFCGLIMADHSKTGINSMINSATVFGVGVNFHGAGYPRNFVPSFTEGSPAGMHEVPLQKFLDIAARVLARRGLSLSPLEIEFYTRLHALTETYR